MICNFGWIGHGRLMGKLQKQDLKNARGAWLAQQVEGHELELHIESKDYLKKKKEKKKKAKDGQMESCG